MKTNKTKLKKSSPIKAGSSKPFSTISATKTKKLASEVDLSVLVYLLPDLTKSFNLLEDMQMANHIAKKIKKTLYKLKVSHSSMGYLLYSKLKSNCDYRFEVS